MVTYVRTVVTYVRTVVTYDRTGNICQDCANICQGCANICQDCNIYSGGGILNEKYLFFSDCSLAALVQTPFTREGQRLFIVL